MRKINFNILHKFCLMDFMRNIPKKVEMIYFKNLKEFGEFGNGLMALIIIYTLTALLESVPLQFFCYFLTRQQIPTEALQRKPPVSIDQ